MRRERRSQEKAVNHLGFPDQHHLNCAAGWLELGNPEEARAEAARISFPGRTHQDAFLVNWRIASRTDCWTEAHRQASAFTSARPKLAVGWICLSYSLYRLRRPLEAWIQLLPKASEFPALGAIPYILACYASEMGNHDLSRRFLHQSAALGGPSEVKGATLETAQVDALVGDCITLHPQPPPNPSRKRLRPA